MDYFSFQLWLRRSKWCYIEVWLPNMALRVLRGASISSPSLNFLWCVISTKTRAEGGFWVLLFLNFVWTKKITIFIVLSCSFGWMVHLNVLVHPQCDRRQPPKTILTDFDFFIFFTKRANCSFLSNSSPTSSTLSSWNALSSRSHPKSY